MALVAVIAGSVACGDQPTEVRQVGPESARESAVPGGRLSLAEVASSDLSALSRNEEWLVVADGLWPSGDDPGLRIWLAPADGLADAEALDFPEAGPLDLLSGGWSGDRFVFVGLECPAPWIPEGVDDEPAGLHAEDCGSEMWRIYSFDPERAELHLLSAELTSKDRSLRFLRGGVDQALFTWTDPGLDLVAVGADGSVSSVPAVPTEESGEDALVTLCPLGEDLVAMQPGPLQLNEENDSYPLPDFFSAVRLNGEAWSPVALPPLPDVQTDYANTLACTRDGIAVVGARGADGHWSAIHLLTGAGEQLTWEEIRLDVPHTDEQIVDVGAIGDDLVAVVRWLPGRAPEGADVDDGFYVWTGTDWRSLGDLRAPFLSGPATAAAILGDGDAIATITQDDVSGIRRIDPQTAEP